MIAALRDLEKWAADTLRELDGDAKAEYDRLLAAVKAEAAADLAKVRVIAGDLEAGLGKAVESAGPSVTAAVNAEVGKALAALAPLLSEAAHDM